MSNTPARPPHLTAGQIGFFIGYGVLLWIVAAMLVRLLAPMGALEGGARALTYALVIPGTLPFVLIARPLGRLARGQVFAAITVTTATALLLDGLAVAWIPWAYGATDALVLAGAAAILWGAGVGLGLAFLVDARQPG